MDGGGRRAQVVIAMAVVVTIALVPIAAAYLQLGYVADDTTPSRHSDASDVTAALSQAVADAEGQVAGEYTWSERSASATAARAWLDPRLVGIETPRDADSIAIRIAYNDSMATRVATSKCPHGDGREFGACRTDGGIVVQERDGDTVLVAVAFDIRIQTPDRSTSMTTVVEP